MRKSTKILPPITMLLVDPMRDRYKWAAVCGQVVLDQGEHPSIEDIKCIAAIKGIQDVFIDEGYRTAEVKEAAVKYGWHCVKGRAGSPKEGIAQIIELACNESWNAPGKESFSE